jgi:hypothetical protein
LSSQAWWNIFVIPAFRRLRKENHKFEVNLGNIVKSMSQEKKKKSVARGRVKKPAGI